MEITQEHLRKLKTLMESVKRAKSGKLLTREQELLWRNLEVDRDVNDLSKIVFDSIGQAAASTGAPKSIFSRDKDSGCPAFKSTRIYFSEWLKWHFAQPMFRDPKAELQEIEVRKQRLKERQEKVATDEAEQRVVPKTEARRALVRYAAAVRTKLLALPRRNALPLSLLKEPLEIEQKLNGEIRQILGEVFRGEWGQIECPNCGKEIRP